MAIIDLAAYPSRFFSNVWIDGISLLVYFYLWSSLFKNKGEVNGYTLASITTYYALTFTIRKLTNSKSISRRISYNISYGTLSIFLLQPLNFFLHYFYRLFTQILFQTIVPLVFVLVLTFYFHILEMPHNVALFFFSLLLASLITYLFYAITGCMAFWTIKAWGINSLIGRVSAILSGAVIPLSFFPKYLQNISQFLPFQYMSYVPVSIYTNNISGGEIYKAILGQIWWVIFLYFSLKLVWNKALFKYDSVGS